MLNLKNIINKTTVLGIVSIALLLSACELNQSVNKDFNTQAYSRGNGLTCNDVTIKVNENNDKRNEYVYGEKVNFSFKNITGFKKIKGKVFPGLSMVIIDNKKDTLLSLTDLLEEFNDGTTLSPLLLQAHFLAALPYKNKEKYTVFIKIWDKKGKGTFEYEMPFTVKENKLLQIKSKGISYSTIYLWDNTSKLVVVDQEIKMKNNLILILEGIEGMNEIENNVFPLLSIEIIDKNGDEILSNPNIFEEFRESGIDAAELFDGQIPVTITFTPGKVENPCRLKSSLIDLKSDKRIDIEAEIVLK